MNFADSTPPLFSRCCPRPVNLGGFAGRGLTLKVGSASCLALSRVGLRCEFVQEFKEIR